ncbi:hypothetical protein ACQUW5_13585 [Legionella sp. CNM-1927-20]|uniref:hypothetical protein n=1 Tax=Legionella sp. CNM-1927-20 TaxID=3422221 RepID=UPI00403B2E7E
MPSNTLKRFDELYFATLSPSRNRSNTDYNNVNTFEEDKLTEFVKENFDELQQELRALEKEEKSENADWNTVTAEEKLQVINDIMATIRHNQPRM